MASKLFEIAINIYIWNIESKKSKRGKKSWKNIE